MSDRSDWYFYTLKPESWMEDLKIESEKKIKRTKKHHSEEVKIEKKRLSELLNNQKEVDNFVTNIL